MGPIYQSNMYRNSNTLLEPVQIPKHSANEGMNKVPTSKRRALFYFSA
jgi:hypothetical protein